LNLQQLLISLGISDISVVAQIVIANNTKQFGPNFRASAEAAEAACTAFALAALTPSA
jgi:hypothetical protein